MAGCSFQIGPILVVDEPFTVYFPNNALEFFASQLLLRYVTQKLDMTPDSD
jgi:hypothetical protein